MTALRLVTRTALAGAMAAFYHKVPVVHVEAGLRTNERYSPFPEEMNRKWMRKISGNDNHNRMGKNQPVPVIWKRMIFLNRCNLQQLKEQVQTFLTEVVMICVLGFLPWILFSYTAICRLISGIAFLIPSRILATRCSVFEDFFIKQN